MKRLVISSTIAAIVAGGAGFAFAGQPGPNGHNDFGLCQAYFAGSQTGQDHKHQAGPFRLSSRPPTRRRAATRTAPAPRTRSRSTAKA